MKRTFKYMLKWMGAEWWTKPDSDLNAIVRVNGRFNFMNSFPYYNPEIDISSSHNLIGCDDKTIIFYDRNEELPYALDIADLLDARVTSIDPCSECYPVIKVSTNKVRQFDHHVLDGAN